MSGISTHVLDTARGRPARGITALLERKDGLTWIEVGSGMTDDDGRIGDLAVGDVTEGVYRLTFETGVWFAGHEDDTFYPEAVIVFEVTDKSEHYHVPLLLSPFGYTTYRGS